MNLYISPGDATEMRMIEIGSPKDKDVDRSPTNFEGDNSRCRDASKWIDEEYEGGFDGAEGTEFACRNGDFFFRYTKTKKIYHNGYRKIRLDIDKEYSFERTASNQTTRTLFQRLHLANTIYKLDICALMK